MARKLSQDEHAARAMALRGAGITDIGMPAAVDLWDAVLERVEALESVYPAIHPNGDICPRAEGNIRAYLVGIVEGVLARRRYLAAVKAQKKRKKGK